MLRGNKMKKIELYMTFALGNEDKNNVLSMKGKKIVYKKRKERQKKKKSEEIEGLKYIIQSHPAH